MEFVILGGGLLIILIAVVIAVVSAVAGAVADAEDSEDQNFIYNLYRTYIKNN